MFGIFLQYSFCSIKKNTEFYSMQMLRVQSIIQCFPNTFGRWGAEYNRVYSLENNRPIFRLRLGDGGTPHATLQ